MIKRIALILLFIGFYFIAYSQEIKYIQNIKRLLLLCNKDLTSYKKDYAEGVGGGLQNLLGVRMQLLPKEITKKYFIKKIPAFWNKTPDYDSIIDLSQESQDLIQLEFYSTWNESYEIGQTPPISKELYDELINSFEKDKWNFVNTNEYINSGYLIFNRQDLQLTVTFEIIEDVQLDPLWRVFHYWEDHNIPNFNRYAHFIFRQNLKYK